ncbi:SDR family NAD(P)-dependent oxidoreductase [Amaricoccus tamworthensis]|uniref:SDR family NAD(P)-dependent oxidoreductase n=1 Tax=Amaricoccus tamworthensis TaxID=57002 RepID=UPI003C7DDD27
MTTAKTVLITGASRGLGYSLGVMLGAAGYQVIAMAKTVGGLEDLADDIEALGGPTPTLVPLSITDDGGMQRLCLSIHERWGSLDVAIHCAAHAPPQSPAPHVAERDFDQSVEINLRGTQRLVTMLEPLLKAAPDGQFVHVDDDRAGQPFFGAYGATKAAAAAYIRSWAAESRQTGPHVTVFSPAPMPTALRARFFPGEDTEGLASCRSEAARLCAAIGLEDVSGEAE